jgi:cytochrome c oxidase subunit I
MAIVVAKEAAKKVAGEAAKEVAVEAGRRGPLAFDVTALAGFPADPRVRRLAAGWFVLALVALALSTVCALLLVAARTPLPGGLAASATWFRGALVLHVGLAVVVWFLACAAGFWTLAADAAGRARWAALLGAALGVTAMVAALLAGGAAPVLANYVPVLNSGLFLAGLALFGAGVAACALASARGALRRRPGRPLELWRCGAALSIGIALLALAVLAAVLAERAGAGAGPLDFEVLAWAPGHVLQFMHVVLLMSVWCVLGERALGRPLAPRGALLALLGAAAAPVLAAPLIVLSWPADGAAFRHAFTTLMAWGSWPAAALLAALLLRRLLRAGRGALAAHLPLALSALLFLLGCGFGAAIRGESTMVPAHYHGTVGAVTLAYMTLGYALLPAFGLARPAGRLARWQPLVYGAGLMILASALAWSGWLGVPRKTLHVDVIVQYPAYFAAMGLAGLGGLCAISGAALFVANIARSLGRAWGGDPAPRRRALAGGVGCAALAGALALLFAPPAPLVAPRADAVEHVAQKRAEEIKSRFERGAALLDERRFEEASAELHRLLALAPQMPEAHVNMGFAMLGLERYAIAQSFFEVAIALRAQQNNAYFGLALALHGAGDLPRALGAMRSYIHLSGPDDPYRANAKAAIDEWQAEQRRGQGAPAAAAPAAGAVPENGKNPSAYPIPEKRFD